MPTLWSAKDTQETAQRTKLKQIRNIVQSRGKERVAPISLIMLRSESNSLYFSDLSKTLIKCSRFGDFISNK